MVDVDKVSNYITVFSNKAENDLFQIESDSWWFQYRAKIIIGLMKRYFDKSTMTTDIGGGNGYTTYIAAKKGFEVELLEPSEAACKNASLRGLKSTRGMLKADFPEDGHFGQVLLLDVLEHIEDDEGFLKLLHQKMEVGGRLLITVPAFMCLWSSEDEYVGHFRRYRLANLKDKMARAGFSIRYSNYFFRFLFLPVLLIRVMFEKIGFLKKQESRTEEERKKVMEKQFHTKGMVDKVLRIIEKREYLRLMRGQKVRYGSSIIIVGEVLDAFYLS